MSIFTFFIINKKNNTTMVFFLSSEHQICGTDGDVESSERENLPKSNNEAINIGQIKGI